MTTPPMRLGGALAPSNTGPAASAFQAALAGSRVCEPYVLRLPNNVELPCVITLLGAELLLDIEGIVRREMAERGLPNDHTTQQNYELARAKLTLAHAVREVDPVKRADAAPLGSVELWGRVPPETIAAVYERLIELRELHDPLADGMPLLPEEVVFIRDAIVKKNWTTLRAFGLQRLIAYLRTTVDQPAP